MLGEHSPDFCNVSCKSAYVGRKVCSVDGFPLEFSSRSLLARSIAILRLSAHSFAWLALRFAKAMPP